MLAVKLKESHSFNNENNEVEFCFENKNRLINYIISLFGNYKHKSRQNAEDIFGDMIEAILAEREKDKPGIDVSSIEDRVFGEARKAYRRFDYRRKKEGFIESSIQNIDGEDWDLFESVSDGRDYYEENIIQRNELDLTLRRTRYKRYIYGIDIFLLLYVRMLTLKATTNVEYEEVLELLGINRDKLKNAEGKISRDEDLLDIMRELELGMEGQKSISILERYVYGAEIIKRSILG